MSIKALKEVCNKLVGTWYCKEIDEEFTFHLNEDLWQTNGKLTVINSLNKHQPFNSLYGVGVYLNPKGIMQDEFYIDIGWFNKRYYKIDNLTSNLLVLREYWMELDRPISNHTVIFKRKLPDASMANEILQGLDLDE